MKRYIKHTIITIVTSILVIYSCTKYDDILTLSENNETKAAVTYSIYAPLDGKVTAMETYCKSGNTHKAGIGAGCQSNNPATMYRPTDIETQSTSVRFYGSSNIKSIKTTTCGILCGSKPSEGWMSNGIFVELFSDIAGKNKIGTVYYGHIKTFSIKNNTLYTSNLNGLELGTIPSSLPPACTCYSTIHVHMTISTNGNRNADFTCNSSVTKGTTTIYTIVK